MAGNQSAHFFVVFLLLISVSFSLSISTALAGEDLENSGIISSPIWYSKKTFFEGDRIKIYSALFNGSSSEKLGGSVVFANNEKELCSQTFVLQPNSFSPVECLWLVPKGKAKISVTISSAYLLDKDGAKKDVSIDSVKVLAKELSIDTDTDGDGVGDREDDDIDGDGLTNKEEQMLGTDLHSVDTDGDGLTDQEEIQVYKTNPLLADTDVDGVPDKEEVLSGTNPLIYDKPFVEQGEESTMGDSSMTVKIDKKPLITLPDTVKPIVNEFVSTIKSDLGLDENKTLSNKISKTEEIEKEASDTAGRILRTGDTKSSGSDFLKKLSFAGIFSGMKQFLFYLDSKFDNARLFVLSIIEDKLDKIKIALTEHGSGIDGEGLNIAGIGSKTLINYIYYFVWSLFFYIFAYKLLFYALFVVGSYKTVAFVYRRVRSDDGFYR